MDHLTARPTIYRGIRMRSRLEARFAAWLDRWCFDWEYEPYAFADRTGQYLPDFALSNIPNSFGVEGMTSTGTTTCYVDVKPPTYDEDLARRRMEIIWSSEPDVALMIASTMHPTGLRGVVAFRVGNRRSTDPWSGLAFNGYCRVCGSVTLYGDDLVCIHCHTPQTAHSVFLGSVDVPLLTV